MSARDLARCEACKAGRGVGATVTIKRTYGVETWYVCGSCAGRVMDTLYGSKRATG